MKKALLIFSVFVIFLSSCREDTIVPLSLGDLFGQVLIESNNEPIEGASITTNPPTTSLVSDQEGRFALESVPSGTYSLRVEKDGYITKLESVLILADQSTNAVVRLSPDSLSNTTPGKPLLLFPAVDSEINIAETFYWSGSDPDGDILKYDVLAFSSDQSETIILAEGITDTSLVVDQLKFGRNYFWQVVAKDDSEETFSEVRPFSVENIPDYRFMFSREVNSLYQIFTGNPGEEEIQLTDLPSNAWRPRLSPARDQIAFISTKGIENHIFSSDRDGSNLFQITNIPISGYNNLDLDFSWSPDGAQMLYMNHNRLYKVNKDGSNLTEIAQAPIGSSFAECDWSGASNQIAVRIVGLQPYNSQIYVIDENGNYLAMVQPDVQGSTTGCAFSVDGKSVLFSQDVSGFESADGRQLDAQLMIRNLFTMGLTNISLEKENGTNDLDARYSPDGAYVIFTNTNNDGISPRSIYTSRLDGEDRELQFDNAEMADWE